jgi:cellulose synthase (UDP-forming)
MVYGAEFNRWRRLKTGLYYVPAVALCALAVIGMVLKGREAVAALSWGWEDLVTPVTSEFKHGQQVNYGVYDLQQRFSRARGVAIEHIFVSWLSSDASDKIKSSFEYAKERNRWLMITIEPYAAEGRRSQLLDDIVAGTYDSTIASVCRTIGSLQAPMLIRWGHEMETADMRYPWSGASGESYIAAYRYFATKCRADAPKIYLVWSPKGAAGLGQYYPGRAFVDLVGLSVYELPAYDLDRFGKAMSFRDAFLPKYNRVVALDRSVIIAEMGVSGDASYQARWMANFFRNVQDFPLLRTAVYFNEKDTPGAWPKKYGTPDWTIDSNVFE